MGRHLGRLEGGLGTGTGTEFFQLGGQRREQFLFDLVHALILRVAAKRALALARKQGLATHPALSPSAALPGPWVEIGFSRAYPLVA